MDPTSLATIATSAVALLSPYLEKAGEEFAKSAGSAAWNKAEKLYQAIKAKFAVKFAAREALDNLAKIPEDPDTQAAVCAELKKVMAVDEKFAKQLAGILKEAAEAGVDRVFNTTIYGDVAKLIQIGDVYGDVTIS
ncbi:MAG: hypothetical protein A3G93_14945 [Nitrospinae bacterium RIFCSPLOWO2_12_FULL_45_22]|nr:MAG: hypothetical protein A3G93_14945 [Nitrospinae bacterium RIFCSPLOWO2_12_FULL_45_22]